jgi:cysteine desulfurase family protein (TIGR01976 family)
MNAADPTEVVVGASATLLFQMLAQSLGQTWQAGDEVIVTNGDHTANVSPWLELEKRGITVKVWPFNRESLRLEVADLEPLWSDRVRLVAFTHTSNILGTLNPVAEICQWVHDRGAWVCVDGVSYAPHRLMDMQAWDVDFYAFSCYKTYGPRQAVLYGKQQHWQGLPGFNHAHITPLPYKFEPGGLNYELVYGLLGLCDYLEELGKQVGDASKDLRGCMAQAFDLMTTQEVELGDRLLSFLTHHPKVQVAGLPTAIPDRRVATISFWLKGIDSATIPSQLAKHHLGLRHGHFNSPRVLEALQVPQQNNGVVRISMVHYNTVEEVDRLIDSLGPILD